MDREAQMKSVRRVAIIGGGVGMMSILYKMAQADIRNCEIYVYRKSTAGIGEAYKLSPDYLIMNTRNDAISFFDSCINYGKWLSENHPALSKKEEFVPRTHRRDWIWNFSRVKAQDIPESYV